VSRVSRWSATARAVGASVLALALGGAVGGCRPAADGTCAAASPRALVADGPPRIDLDEDGLDDGFEENLVRAHLPFLAHHPEDRCALAGIVYRARPHPQDPRLVHVTYSQLFALDCGLNGHVGDNEAFGATIDPALPPPAGLVALVAISHQGTPCERTTTCGTCPGMPPCDVVDGRPVLYTSKDKHAGAVDIGGGCSFGSCLDECALPLLGATVPLVNAGEPERPLLRDLSGPGGFIDERWPEELRGHDPWGGAEFGTAGIIAEDLVDELLLTPACTCSP
jgi:hypothetical protein